MCLAERNHEIRALAAYLSDQPFAVGVRLQRSRFGVRNTLRPNALSCSSTSAEKTESRSRRRKR